MDTPGDDDRGATRSAGNESGAGLDIASIALLVFFVALIVVVAGLLLLPVLNG
jgi:hypothetical protein